MNRLKELRKAKHLSQEELGSVLGVQKAAVCKYETGRVALPNEMLMKLCDFLTSARIISFAAKAQW